MLPMSWVTSATFEIFNCVENGDEVARLGDLLVSAFGMRRQAHAAQIGNDHRVILDQIAASGSHMSPVSPKTVQQQHRRPLAADADILRAARHRHLLRAEARREGLNLGGGRCRRGERRDQHYRRKDETKGDPRKRTGHGTVSSSCTTA